jgi:hypothetical protein
MKTEIEEGFIAQKTCDGKPYLHFGTAKDAVPPVGMAIGALDDSTQAASGTLGLLTVFV